jgi:hypothetical protein
MKVAKARIRKTAYGSYSATARGVSLRIFHKDCEAGKWLEFMTRNGFVVHEHSDVQPSGVMPEGWLLNDCEHLLARVKHHMDNHPAKGKTPEQYQAECREARVQSAIKARERQEANDRLEAAGWDDTRELLKLLFSYGPDNPYSMDKFNEDRKKLEIKREAVAAGIIN